MLPSLNKYFLRIFSVLFILTSISVTVAVTNDTIKKQIINSYAKGGCEDIGSPKSRQACEREKDAKDPTSEEYKKQQAYRNAHPEIYKTSTIYEKQSDGSFKTFSVTYKNGSTTPQNKIDITSSIKWGKSNDPDAPLTLTGIVPISVNNVPIDYKAPIIIPLTQTEIDKAIKEQKEKNQALIDFAKANNIPMSTNTVREEYIPSLQEVEQYQQIVQQAIKDYGLPTSIDGPDLNGLVGTIDNGYLESAPSFTDYSKPQSLAEILTYSNTSTGSTIMDFFRNTPIGGTTNAIYNPQNYRGDNDVAMSLIDNLLIPDDYKNNWQRINNQNGGGADLTGLQAAFFDPLGSTNSPSGIQYANLVSQGFFNSDTRNATIDYGLDITKAVGTAVALPAIGTKLAVEGGWAALTTAFQANMVINTATGTVETAQTCGNNGWSPECGKELLQSATNWAFLGSMDKLASVYDAASAARASTYMAVTTAGQFAINIPATIQTCKNGEGLNCTLMIGSDMLLAFGSYQNASTVNRYRVSYNLWRSTAKSPVTTLPSGTLINTPADDVVDAIVANADDVTSTMNIPTIEITPSNSLIPAINPNSSLGLLYKIPATSPQLSNLIGANVANNIPIVNLTPPVIPPLDGNSSPIGASQSVTDLIYAVTGYDLHLDQPISFSNALANLFNKPSQSTAEIATKVGDAIADSNNLAEYVPTAKITFPEKDVPFVDIEPSTADPFNIKHSESIIEPSAPLAETPVEVEPPQSPSNFTSSNLNDNIIQPIVSFFNPIAQPIIQAPQPFLFAPAQNPIVSIVKTWIQTGMAKANSKPVLVQNPTGSTNGNSQSITDNTGGLLKIWENNPIAIFMKKADLFGEINKYIKDFKNLTVQLSQNSIHKELLTFINIPESPRTSNINTITLSPEILEQMNSAIVQTTNDGIERSSDFFINPNGTVFMNEFDTGLTNENSANNGFREILKSFGLIKKPMIYYHTHPKNFGLLSPTDIVIAATKPKSGFIHIVGFEDGYVALVPTRESQSNIFNQNNINTRLIEKGYPTTDLEESLKTIRYDIDYSSEAQSQIAKIIEGEGLIYFRFEYPNTNLGNNRDTSSIILKRIIPDLINNTSNDSNLKIINPVQQNLTAEVTLPMSESPSLPVNNGRMTLSSPTTTNVGGVSSGTPINKFQILINDTEVGTITIMGESPNTSTRIEITNGTLKTTPVYKYSTIDYSSSEMYLSKNDIVTFGEKTYIFKGTDNTSVPIFEETIIADSHTVPTDTKSITSDPKPPTGDMGGLEVGERAKILIANGWNEIRRRVANIPQILDLPIDRLVIGDIFPRSSLPNGMLFAPRDFTPTLRIAINVTRIEIDILQKITGFRSPIARNVKGNLFIRSPFDLNQIASKLGILTPAQKLSNAKFEAMFKYREQFGKNPNTQELEEYMSPAQITPTKTNVAGFLDRYVPNLIPDSWIDGFVPSENIMLFAPNYVYQFEKMGGITIKGNVPTDFDRFMDKPLSEYFMPVINKSIDFVADALAKITVGAIKPTYTKRIVITAITLANLLTMSLAPYTPPVYNPASRAAVAIVQTYIAPAPQTLNNPFDLQNVLIAPAIEPAIPAAKFIQLYPNNPAVGVLITNQTAITDQQKTIAFFEQIVNDYKNTSPHELQNIINSYDDSRLPLQNNATVFVPPTVTASKPNIEVKHQQAFAEYVAYRISNSDFKALLDKQEFVDYLFAEFAGQYGNYDKMSIYGGWVGGPTQCVSTIALLEKGGVLNKVISDLDMGSGSDIYGLANNEAYKALNNSTNNGVQLSAPITNGQSRSYRVFSSDYEINAMKLADINLIQKDDVVHFDAIHVAKIVDVIRDSNGNITKIIYFDANNPFSLNDPQFGGTLSFYEMNIDEFMKLLGPEGLNGAVFIRSSLTDTSSLIIQPEVSSLTPAINSIVSSNNISNSSSLLQNNLIQITNNLNAFGNKEVMALAERFVGKAYRYDFGENLCGVLAAKVMAKTGYFDPNLVSKIYQWDPTREFDKRKILFPTSKFTEIDKLNNQANDIGKYDWKNNPLQVGDYVFLRGTTFSHQLVVTEIDNLGRAYSVTNHFTIDSSGVKTFNIDRILLYDPNNLSNPETWCQVPQLVHTVSHS